MPKPPRVYKTPAIVLRQRKLGDTDKIVTLYTAEQGKVEAVAKGVRRVTSRLAGSVEPLSHGSFMFAHGRNLDVITQVQPIETFPSLRTDLERLSRALYAAELVDRATEERSENFTVYRLLLDALRRLDQQDELDLPVRYFEMALLGELGYRPQLESCVLCGTSPPDEGNCFAPGAGGLLCPNCRPPETAVTPVSKNALRLLQLLQAGGYQAVASLQLDRELAAELERHLRDAIHFALEREVRSASFVEAVRRRLRNGPAAAAGQR